MKKPRVKWSAFMQNWYGLVYGSFGYVNLPKTLRLYREILVPLNVLNGHRI